MNRGILKFLFACFLFSSVVLPQDDSKFIKDNENTLTRSRILFGYSSLIRHKKEPDFKNIFLNVNHRTSEFNPVDKPLKVKWAFEVGMNGLSVQDANFSGFVLVPYLKGGPEINPAKNLFVGCNAGLAASVIGYFVVFPYWGVNTYYLIPVNERLYWEFEFGYHTSFFMNNNPYLFYIAGGLAIK